MQQYIVPNTLSPTCHSKFQDILVWINSLTKRTSSSSSGSSFMTITGPGDDLLRRLAEGAGGGSKVGFQEEVPVLLSEEDGLAIGEFCLAWTVMWLIALVLSALAEARLGTKLGLGIEMVMEGTDPPGSLLFRKEGSVRPRWCSDVCVAAPADRGCG